MKRNKITFLLITILALLSACDKTEIEESAVDESPEIFVAGYLPWYGFERFNLETLRHLDRLYYFSVAPDTLGNYSMPNTQKEQIEILQERTKNTSTELFVVIGGWYESETIFAMAKSAEKREAYVNALIQFCVANTIDGVDLDWEAYPTAVPEADYVALVDLLSTKLREKDLKFTVAVAASHYNLAAKFKNKVDQLNVMSYGVLDQNGNQVPMSMLKGWLENFDTAGVPRNKLIVGVPFYGKRPYDANDSSPRAIIYSSIVKQSYPEETTNKFGKYGFNGINWIETKTKYLRNNGYHGIMSWELSQDVDYSSPYCLLKSMVEAAK